ncbi:MAG: hypothetical protein IJ646_04365 [Clostridia bacterium]|nr:hypothetical protein [Clostridia bacterium]
MDRLDKLKFAEQWEMGNAKWEMAVQILSRTAAHAKRVGGSAAPILRIAARAGRACPTGSSATADGFVLISIESAVAGFSISHFQFPISNSHASMPDPPLSRHRQEQSNE